MDATASSRRQLEPWSEAEDNLLRLVMRAHRSKGRHIDWSKNGSKIAKVMNERARDENISDRVYSASSVQQRYSTKSYKEKVFISQDAPEKPKTPKDNRKTKRQKAEEVKKTTLEDLATAAVPDAPLEVVKPSMETVEIPDAERSDLRETQSNFGYLDWDVENDNSRRAVSL